MILATLLALAAPQAADEIPAVMTITVQKLPASYKQAPVVHLDFKADGSVATCKVEQTSGHAKIDEIACQQLQSGLKLEPEDGKAPAARSAKVVFEAGQG